MWLEKRTRSERNAYASKAKKDETQTNRKSAKSDAKVFRGFNENGSSYAIFSFVGRRPAGQRTVAAKQF